MQRIANRNNEVVDTVYQLMRIKPSTQETMLLNHFKQYFVRWIVFIITTIWLVNTFILDDRVERHELPDDSVIVVLGKEEKHRFKVPVEYLYDVLLMREFSEKQTGISNTKFKKVYRDGDYFHVYATYPDMKPVDRSNDKPGRGNKLTISIGIDNEPSPLDGKKHGRSYLSYQKDPGGGIVPEGFGSNDVVKFEDSAGDVDRYFYQEGVFFMRCDKKEATADYSPSCQMYSSYKDLALYVAFSNQYKAEFLKIENLVQELFASFEQP